MLVYHYCSSETFEKIITGKSLLLSDITKSNDSMEILWITRFIKDIFDEEFEKEKKRTKYFEENYPLDIFNELIDHFIESSFNEKERIYSYFVCCFSAVGDLLSQWRGYADDACGYAIGFDLDVLSQIGNYPKLNNQYSVIDVGEVEYTESYKKAKIKETAKELVSNLKLIARNIDKGIKEDSILPFDRCFYKLFRQAIYMKNPFFKEEKEWRICLCDYGNNNLSNPSDYTLKEGISLSEVNYRFKQNDLVPFVKLDFSNCKHDIIREVIIGPKCSAREDDVRIFLKDNNIDCEVIKSDGTYR